jgi:hypothetical protein
MSNTTYLFLFFSLMVLCDAGLKDAPSVSAHRIPVLVSAERALLEGRLPEAAMWDAV